MTEEFLNYSFKEPTGFWPAPTVSWHTFQKARESHLEMECLNHQQTDANIRVSYNLLMVTKLFATPQGYQRHNFWRLVKYLLFHDFIWHANASWQRQFDPIPLKLDIYSTAIITPPKERLSQPVSVILAQLLQGGPPLVTNGVITTINGRK